MYTFIYVTLLLIATFNGFGASLFYVAQGSYLASCANDKNIGLFTSIFLIFMRAAMLLGDLMGAFVIANVKGSTFYMILTGLCFCSSFFFCCLTKPVPQTMEEEIVTDEVNLTKSILTKSAIEEEKP